MDPSQPLSPSKIDLFCYEDMDFEKFIEEEDPAQFETPRPYSMINLFCYEDIDFEKFEEITEEEAKEFEATTTLEEVEEDYLNFSLNKEINDYGVRIHESVNDITADWFKAGRLEAVACIYRTEESFGFGDETSYLAVTYMDRFLLVHLMQADELWKWTLLSLACLSLAAKMEKGIKPQSLQLPRNQRFNFEEKTVGRLEWLVVKELEWKMISVSPFPFVHYFVPRLRLNTSITVSEVVTAIFTAIQVEMTSRWRPSTIAAAATLFTLDKTLTQESLEQRIETLPCRASLNIEDIVSFYKFLIILTSNITNTNVSPPPSPPFQLPGGDAAESSTRSAGAVGSRRSLTFGQGEHNMENDDNKRQK